MQKHSMSNLAGCALLLLSALMVGPAWSGETQTQAQLHSSACMRPSCERVPVIFLRRVNAISPVSPAQAAFNRADSDHDDRLNLQEAEHFPAMAPHFRLIDTNRDNFLSFEELMRAATEGP